MRERNYFIDNTRALLIFLVVLGHLLEPLIGNSHILKVVYLFIYSFHIPMFVLLSGMLARTNIDRGGVCDIVSSLLIPFLVFQVLYEILEFVLNGHFSNYIVNGQPYWLLWFLWSLFLWKLMLPIFSCFKFPVIMSVLLSLVASYSPHTGYYLGISRTLTFFPFFVLGYALKPDFFMKLKSYHPLFFMAMIVITLLLCVYFEGMPQPQQWLYGSYSYSALGCDEWFAGVVKLFLAFLAFFTGISVLSLLSGKQLKISSCGEHSLYVYLWHGIFVKIFGVVGGIAIIGKSGAWSVLFLFSFISLALTFLFSRRSVVLFTNQGLLLPLRKIFLECKR